MGGWCRDGSWWDGLIEGFLEHPPGRLTGTALEELAEVSPGPVADVE